MAEERSEERVGSLLFSSPEMLLIGYNHSLATDIWSAGVLLFIMLGGFFPFLSSPPTQEGITFLIVRGQVDLSTPEFYNVSPLAKDLVLRMLQVDERRRITISQVLQHPWFTRVY
jgi:serine/threonine protein kinase